jgi:hypothetical protein
MRERCSKTRSFNVIEGGIAVSSQKMKFDTNLWVLGVVIFALGCADTGPAVIDSPDDVPKIRDVVRVTDVPRTMDVTTTVDGGRDATITDGTPQFDVPVMDVRGDTLPMGDVVLSDVAGDGGCRAREVCGNGIDDNCNGVSDEGCACLPGSTQRCYNGVPSQAGVGVCNFGMQMCTGTGEFGTWTPCMGAGRPREVVCGQRMDFRCNNIIDEGCNCRPGERRACYTGPTETRTVGLCRDGSQVCVAMGSRAEWGTCEGQVLPTMNRCDGTDRACTGMPFAGCPCVPGMTRMCYGGPTGTAGVGTCRAGTQTCMTSGTTSTWGACTGQVLPATDRCDGRDTNCDGTVNTGCACMPGETRMCYTGPGGTRGVGLCRAGSQMCVAGSMGGSDWGACTGQVLPSAAICDGSDHACNGRPYETCECQPDATRRCYSGPAGTAGVGICRAGTQTCALREGVPQWGSCTGEILPGTSTCDGTDRACTGMPFAGCPCVPGMTRTCYGGPMATAGVGTCRAGTQTCMTAGTSSTWGACTGQVLPAPDRCDGRDTDCNGTIDSACACRPGETRGCYGGAASTRGVGVCRDGSQTCNPLPAGGSSWTTCAGERGPEAPACDGLDHECNGMPYRTCNCVPGMMRTCYTGAMGTRGVGICRAGSQTCVLNAGVPEWGTCAGEVVPEAAACDGVDHECNGMPYRTCVCVPGATRSCYDGAAGTAGTGTCRAGTQTCVSMTGVVRWGTCTGQVLPTPDVCDGRDTDCDGTVNSGCGCTPGMTRSCYAGAAGTAGVGLCRAGTQTCERGTGGVGSSWSRCVGEVLPAMNRCDGTDARCDAMPWAGCVCAIGMSRACYSGAAGTRNVGACRDGTQACIAGTGGVATWATGCTGEVLAATTDMCGNNIDDNCNGTIDEGCGPTVTCPADVTVEAGTGVMRTVTAMARSGTIASYAWSIVASPAGGVGTPSEWTPAPPNAATEIFRPLIVGAYTLRVVVTDSRGMTGTCETRVNAVGRGLRVEMLWDGAGDVDLHLRNAASTTWFSSPNDCYFANRTPVWGTAATSPALDVDNTTANGPENIRIDNPVIGQAYTIGVHNWTGASGRIATIRVYCGGVLVPTQTYMSRALTGMNTGDNCNNNDFWRVASVVFTSTSTCTVTPINTYARGSTVCSGL